MSQKRLRELLEDLRDELRRTGEVPPTDRELLSRLDEDIHRVLESDEPEPDEASGLEERLRDSMVRLEESHPQLAAGLQNVVQYLSNMGI